MEIEECIGGGNKIIEIEGRSSEQEIQEKIVNMQAKEISL